MIEASDATRSGGNRWTIGCLALVLANWALLAYLAFADAVLEEDTASIEAFGPVYGLLGVATVAAPVAGIVAVLTSKTRGQRWLAWIAFGTAAVLPSIYVIGLVLLVSLGGDGFGPD